MCIIIHEPLAGCLFIITLIRGCKTLHCKVVNPTSILCPDVQFRSKRAFDPCRTEYLLSQSGTIYSSLNNSPTALLALPLTREQ